MSVYARVKFHVDKRRTNRGTIETSEQIRINKDTSPFESFSRELLWDSNSQKQYPFARNTLASNSRPFYSQMEKCWSAWRSVAL